MKIWTFRKTWREEKKKKRFSVNAVLLLGDSFFTGGAGSPQGHSYRAGRVHYPWNGFLQPSSAWSWDVDGPFAGNQQDPKHCQAGDVLRLCGGELSLSWACNIWENKTFTTDITYLFSGGSSWMGLLISWIQKDSTTNFQSENSCSPVFF